MATQQQISTPRVWRHRARKAGVELGGGELAGAARQVFAETISRHFGVSLAACLKFAGLLSDDAIARASRRGVIMAITRDYRIYEGTTIAAMSPAAADAALIFNLSGVVAEARQRLAARSGGDA